MTKTKVFVIFILAFLSIEVVKGQIDSVAFEVDTTINPILRVGFRGFYYSGGNATAFVSTDTANFDFSWTFDGVKSSEVMPRTVNVFPGFTPNPHEIIFETVVRADGSVFADTILLPLYDRVAVPNVFTPTNEDGINDLFVVRSSGNSILNITIYNKNGIVIYKQQSPVIVWDGIIDGGSAKNRFCKPGVYFYVLKAQDGSIEPRKGIIYLY